MIGWVQIGRLQTNLFDTIICNKLCDYLKSRNRKSNQPI